MLEPTQQFLLNGDNAIGEFTYETSFVGGDGTEGCLEGIHNLRARKGDCDIFKWFLLFGDRWLLKRLSVPGFSKMHNKVKFP